ncbi:MAG: ABC transporter permease subunit [Sedimentisphaerales bacterium]|nr:ABC transporter permease subunit [Sedimentisphaerales bacterium]
MASLTINPCIKFLRFFWLTGPLFDKELRVSSRRRRNYYLRFAYVILLTSFVVGTWLSYGQLHGTLAYQKSRLAEIGKSIVLTIVVFQFFAAQILAVILLSNSISDEIYHRTLGVLMTTPINSLQIVIGKLFSKLLQIIILLAISLPILAIVRVFGGVPWGYIISSFFITLSASIFAGSISLAFSIKNIHTYVVIIKAVFTIGVVYIVLPLILAAVFGEQWLYVLNYSRRISMFPLLIAFLHLNPLGTMSLNTVIMMSPAATIPFFFWPINCIIMLIASALVLAFSVKVVRRVALRQILGELDLFSRLRLSFSNTKRDSLKEYEGSVREVTGQPVMWKEIRKPLIQGIDRTNNKVGLAATVVTLLLTYYVCYTSNCLAEGYVHFLYAVMFVIIGIIFNLVLSVSCITSEKESMAWPILLTTSLDDWQIVQGKALGVFYKCLPVWLLLAGHIFLFTIVGYINPIAFLQLLIVVSGLMIFLTGFGLYASSCFKRTTWAIIICFAFALVIWVFVPVSLRIVTEIIRNRELYRELSGIYYCINPIVQIGVVMDAAGGAYNANSSLTGLKYDWPYLSYYFRNVGNVYSTTKLLLYIMTAYSLFGLFFAWLAKRRIRKNII